MHWTLHAASSLVLWRTSSPTTVTRTCGGSSGPTVKFRVSDALTRKQADDDGDVPEGDIPIRPGGRIGLRPHPLDTRQGNPHGSPPRVVRCQECPDQGLPVELAG